MISDDTSNDGCLEDMKDVIYAIELASLHDPINSDIHDPRFITGMSSFLSHGNAGDVSCWRDIRQPSRKQPGYRSGCESIVPRHRCCSPARRPRPEPPNTFHCSECDVRRAQRLEDQDKGA